MARLRTITAIVAVGLGLIAAPAAMAKHTGIGRSNGSATANICLLSVDCTYVNYHNGRPSDVARHTGTLTAFSVGAGSIGGQVQLRVLRPVAHGKLRFVSSSAIETITTTGENAFATHLKVKAGDVLALSNSSSGIYMETAPAGTCVRYFDTSLPDGSAGKPTHITPQLHLLLSAQLHY